MPEELRRRIPPPGPKPRRSAIQHLVLDLCAWKAIGAREPVTLNLQAALEAFQAVAAELAVKR